MKRDPRIDAVAASDLSSAAILASLMSILQAKNLLSEGDVREVYDHALLLLEHRQGSAPEIAHIFEAARGVIETQLR